MTLYYAFSLSLHVLMLGAGSVTTSYTEEKTVSVDSLAKIAVFVLTNTMQQDQETEFLILLSRGIPLPPHRTSLTPP